MRTSTRQILAASILISCPATLRAEETLFNSSASKRVQTAELTGQLSDGSQAEPVPPELPVVEVKNQSTVKQENRKLTFTKIAPLSLPPKSEPQLPQQPVSEPATYDAEAQPTNVLILSATVYNHEKTFLQWFCDGEEFIAWSNVDFMHLTGFCSYKISRDDGTTQEYHLILAAGDSSLKDLKTAERAGDFTIPVIPRISEGPAFIVTKGNAKNGMAIEPIQGLHKLYQSQAPILKNAFESRKQKAREQEEALRLNPPKQKDVEILYWRKKHR